MVQWKGLKSVCCGEPRLLQSLCTIIAESVDSDSDVRSVNSTMYVVNHGQHTGIEGVNWISLSCRRCEHEFPSVGPACVWRVVYLCGGAGPHL